MGNVAVGGPFRIVFIRELECGELPASVDPFLTKAIPHPNSK